MPSEQPKWSKTCSFLDRSCGKRSTCGSIRQDQGLLSASAASHNFLKSQYYFFNRLLKLLVSNRVFEMNPTSIFHYPKGFLATIRRLKSKSIRKKIFIPGLQNIAYSSFTNIRHIFFYATPVLGLSAFWRRASQYRAEGSVGASMSIAQVFRYSPSILAERHREHISLCLTPMR